MSNHNRPSRSASIPIPISSRQNIEDMLNLNGLSPPSSSAQSPPRQDRSYQRSIANSRPYFGGLQASRPNSTRHMSTSANSTSSRHPLGGSSGPTWGPRSLSSNSVVNPIIPTARTAGFEPRVIRGRNPHSISEDGTHQHRQDGVSIAQLRRDSLMPIRGNARRPSTSGGHSYASSPSVHLSMSANSQPDTHESSATSSSDVAFPTPTYLRHSALRHLLRTDAPPSLPSNKYDASIADSLENQEQRNRHTTPPSDSDDDSEASFGAFSRNMARNRDRGRGRDREPTTTYASSSPLSSPAPIQRLPTRWSEQDRNSSLTISQDGRELHFHGPTSQGDKEAAAARANYSVPPACGIYYFEVEILSKGQKGHISIGYSVSDVRLTRLPGWEKNSWGYHGDDGNSFASDKKGAPYGPGFTAGDVVGCGLDFNQYRVFYTKNGEFLGYVFENVGKESPVFPSVGLRTAGESVKANFGRDPFVFAIDAYAHDISEKAWTSIQRTRIKWMIDSTNHKFVIGEDKGSQEVVTDGTNKLEEKVDLIKTEDVDEYQPTISPEDFREPIDKLVFSYLSHYGFEKTARALRLERVARDKASSLALKGAQGRGHQDLSTIKVENEDVKMEDVTIGPGTSLDTSDDISSTGYDHCNSDLQYRQRIVNAIVEGNVNIAIEEIEARYPEIFTRNNMLISKLKCRKFVELVLDASDVLKKIKAEAEAKEVEHEVTANADACCEKGTVLMDIDEDAFLPLFSNGSNGLLDGLRSDAGDEPFETKDSDKFGIHSDSLLSSEYNTAVSEALAYGQKLYAEYSGTNRPEVEALFKQSFSLVAYDDPMEAGGEIAEIASHESRLKLAQEVNLAILESQGRPSRPALETLYRHTAVIITQLGLLGVGAAAFADMTKEFCQR